MRASDFLTPQQLAELQALKEKLEAAEAPKPKVKGEKEVLNDQAQALYKVANEKARLKAFMDILEPAARGFATKIRNAAYDRGQLAKLESDDAFLKVVLDAVVSHIRKN